MILDSSKFSIDSQIENCQMGMSIL